MNYRKIGTKERLAPSLVREDRKWEGEMSQVGKMGGGGKDLPPCCCTSQLLTKSGFTTSKWAECETKPSKGDEVGAKKTFLSG